MNGFFNVLKPSGITSSDVVIKIRNIVSKANNTKVKAGHLGTLDPLGAGVLPIAVGSATKLFEYLLNKKKLYRTTFFFGISTNTLDSDGQVTETTTKEITKKDILDVMPNFLGDIEQIPPKFSSKSVDGVRAYKLARQGLDVKLQAKKVSIYDFRLIEGADNKYTFDILCSGGTYIRSICRDMAQLLHTSGYMSSIIRIANGDFEIEDSKTIDEIQKNVQNNFLDIREFGSALQSYYITCEQKKIDNGVCMKFADMPEDIFELYVNEKAYGIATANTDRLKVILRYVD